MANVIIGGDKKIMFSIKSFKADKVLKLWVD